VTRENGVHTYGLSPRLPRVVCSGIVSFQPLVADLCVIVFPTFSGVIAKLLNYNVPTKRTPLPSPPSLLLCS
jgi:hypothetical protein